MNGFRVRFKPSLKKTDFDRCQVRYINGKVYNIAIPHTAEFKKKTHVFFSIFKF
jgi:hypothetical protein